MKTFHPYIYKSFCAMAAVLAAAGAAHAQDDVVVIESGSVHTLRLDGPGVQVLAAHDDAAVHAVSTAGVSEPAVDGGVSDTPAPGQIRAVAKCGDGSLVYSRHGTLCAERGGITRLYQ